MHVPSRWLGVGCPSGGTDLHFDDSVTAASVDKGTRRLEQLIFDGIKTVLDSFAGLLSDANHRDGWAEGETTSRPIETFADPVDQIERRLQILEAIEAVEKRLPAERYWVLRPLLINALRSLLKPRDTGGRLDNGTIKEALETWHLGDRRRLDYERELLVNEAPEVAELIVRIGDELRIGTQGLITTDERPRRPTAIGPGASSFRQYPQRQEEGPTTDPRRSA